MNTPLSSSTRFIESAVNKVNKLVVAAESSTSLLENAISSSNALCTRLRATPISIDELDEAILIDETEANNPLGDDFSYESSGNILNNGVLAPTFREDVDIAEFMKESVEVRHNIKSLTSLHRLLDQTNVRVTNYIEKLKNWEGFTTRLYKLLKVEVNVKPTLQRFTFLNSEPFPPAFNAIPPAKKLYILMGIAKLRQDGHNAMVKDIQAQSNSTSTTVLSASVIAANTATDLENKFRMEHNPSRAKELIRKYFNMPIREAIYADTMQIVDSLTYLECVYCLFLGIGEYSKYKMVDMDVSETTVVAIVTPGAIAVPPAATTTTAATTQPEEVFINRANMFRLSTYSKLVEEKIQTLRESIYGYDQFVTESDIEYLDLLKNGVCPVAICDTDMIAKFANGRGLEKFGGAKSNSKKRTADTSVDDDEFDYELFLGPFIKAAADVTGGTAFDTFGTFMYFDDISPSINDKITIDDMFNNIRNFSDMFGLLRMTFDEFTKSANLDKKLKAFMDDLEKKAIIISNAIKYYYGDETELRKFSLKHLIHSFNSDFFPLFLSTRDLAIIAQYANKKYKVLGRDATFDSKTIGGLSSLTFDYLQDIYMLAPHMQVMALYIFGLFKTRRNLAFGSATFNFGSMPGLRTLLECINSVEHVSRPTRSSMNSTTLFDPAPTHLSTPYNENKVNIMPLIMPDTLLDDQSSENDDNSRGLYTAYILHNIFDFLFRTVSFEKARRKKTPKQLETLQKIQLSNYFRIDSADDFDAKFEQTAQILGAIESALPIDIMNANYTMNNSTFIQVSSQLSALNRLVNDKVDLSSLYNAHRGLMGDSVMTNVSVYLFQFYKAQVEKKKEDLAGETPEEKISDFYKNLGMGGRHGGTENRVKLEPTTPHKNGNPATITAYNQLRNATAASAVAAAAAVTAAAVAEAAANAFYSDSVETTVVAMATTTTNANDINNITNPSPFLLTMQSIAKYYTPIQTYYFYLIPRQNIVTTMVLSEKGELIKVDSLMVPISMGAQPNNDEIFIYRNVPKDHYFENPINSNTYYVMSTLPEFKNSMNPNSLQPLHTWSVNEKFEDFSAEKKMFFLQTNVDNVFRFVDTLWPKNPKVTLFVGDFSITVGIGQFYYYLTVIELLNEQLRKIWLENQDEIEKHGYSVSGVYFTRFTPPKNMNVAEYNYNDLFLRPYYLKKNFLKKNPSQIAETSYISALDMGHNHTSLDDLFIDIQYSSNNVRIAEYKNDAVAALSAHISRSQDRQPSLASSKDLKTKVFQKTYNQVYFSDQLKNIIESRKTVKINLYDPRAPKTQAKSLHADNKNAFGCKILKLHGGAQKKKRQLRDYIDNDEYENPKKTKGQPFPTPKKRDSDMVPEGEYPRPISSDELASVYVDLALEKEGPDVDISTTLSPMPILHVADYYKLLGESSSFVLKKRADDETRVNSGTVETTVLTANELTTQMFTLNAKMDKMSDHLNIISESTAAQCITFRYMLREIICTNVLYFFESVAIQHLNKYPERYILAKFPVLATTASPIVAANTLEVPMVGDNMMYINISKVCANLKDPTHSIHKYYAKHPWFDIIVEILSQLLNRNVEKIYLLQAMPIAKGFKDFYIGIFLAHLYINVIDVLDPKKKKAAAP